MRSLLSLSFVSLLGCGSNENQPEAGSRAVVEFSFDANGRFCVVESDNHCLEDDYDPGMSGVWRECAYCQCPEGFTLVGRNGTSKWTTTLVCLED